MREYLNFVNEGNHEHPHQAHGYQTPYTIFTNERKAEYSSGGYLSFGSFLS